MSFEEDTIKKRVETRKKRGWWKNPEQVRQNISNGHGGANSRTAWHRKSVKVMEKHLGRKLIKGETIHHIDGNPSNNIINNLILFPSKRAHNNFHRIQRENLNFNYKYKGRNKQYKQEWYKKNRKRILSKWKTHRGDLNE